MKLAPRDHSAYFAKPDPERAGLLIYGPDAMRVALKRQDVIAAFLGPGGEEEMRLTRIAAADLRKDGALLLDGLKAQGFFPGQRVVFLEDAGDGLTADIEAAMAAWAPGDAALVVTAGQLTARSKLRKLFEGHKNAFAAAVYADPPSRGEIEATLTKAGVTLPERDAMEDLSALARVLDPGDFRQTVEKLALFKFGDASPVTSEDIAAVAPATFEAALDDLLHIVAEARATEIGPMLSRLEAQGVAAVGLCIGATRHFRTLHAAASDPGGPSAGIARVRPPVFGPRRDRMTRQASQWGRVKLEQALGVLVETDLTLRSSAPVPTMAVMERALIRLAMLGRS